MTRGLYQYLHGYIETEPGGEGKPWSPPHWYRRVFEIFGPDPEDRATVPVPLPPFIRQIPPGERYSRYIQGRIYRIVGASFLSLALSRFQNRLTDRQGLDAYRHLFWGYRDKPTVMGRWREDAEFARQRVAGVNPTMLPRLTAVPDKFPVTDDLLAGLLAPGETLGAHAAVSIENARLYESLRGSLETQVQLTHAHARFVPHQFLETLGRPSIAELKLGDHVQAKASILFSDIRGFTSLVEGMTPMEAICFINTYLSRMEPAVIAGGGSVDSDVGDAVMSVFDRGADAAVSAGIEMLRRLGFWQRMREAASGPDWNGIERIAEK